VTKEKSASACVRVACSLNCVLAAASLYLQQVLANIIRAWKWEDHADCAQFWNCSDPAQQSCFPVFKCPPTNNCYILQFSIRLDTTQHPQASLSTAHMCCGSKGVWHLLVAVYLPSNVGAFGDNAGRAAANVS